MHLTEYNVGESVAHEKLAFGTKSGMEGELQLGWHMGMG